MLVGVWLINAAVAVTAVALRFRRPEADKSPMDALALRAIDLSQMIAAAGASRLRGRMIQAKCADDGCYGSRWDTT